MDDKMELLNQQIYDFHCKISQSSQQLCSKLLLRDSLYHLLSPLFPECECGLYIVGSSVNGFGIEHSDMDLCLMISDREIDQRSEAVDILYHIAQALIDKPLVLSMLLISAKVPILRITFNPTYDNIIVDLNVNNSVAVRNTHMLSYYSQFDWRVRPLVTVVKEWARRKGINNACRASLTSYSLVLMLINYLQCGAAPAVLPSLQKIYSTQFNPTSNVQQLSFSMELPYSRWICRSKESLANLLLGFLRYYSNEFDFDKDVVSIRVGKRIGRDVVARSKSQFNTLHQWQYICIEEPFTLSNTAHSVFDERTFQTIKKTFADGYSKLASSKDLHRLMDTYVEVEAGPQVSLMPIRKLFSALDLNEEKETDVKVCQMP